VLLTVSRPQGYTLEDIYKDAISQLRAFKDAGHLSPADHESLLKTEKPEDILDTLQEAIERNVTLHTDTKRRAQSVLEPLLLRLERFGSAIDILAQSSPQAMGLNLVGLIWGSVRFLLVVSKSLNISSWDMIDVKTGCARHYRHLQSRVRNIRRHCEVSPQLGNICSTLWIFQNPTPLPCACPNILGPDQLRPLCN
jgi:hypothetical protein